MFSPDNGHAAILERKGLLAFDEDQDFTEQKQQITDKLRQLLGDQPERVPLNPTVEYEKDQGTYIERRIVFDVEKDVQAVCLFCIPKTENKKVPLVICVQGHSTGMHNSMGRNIYEGDHAGSGDRDNGLQALERGYAALCLEQRGMGERRTTMVWNEDDNGSPRCHATAMVAALVGRTLLGERCWDISRAIDLALTYPEIDADRIICTGNSGGGTATYYAACMDERIAVAMPSCAVCTFRDSIAAMPHCECNYVPGLGKYMDMGDMAAAIAPRKLIVIHGTKDPIFPDIGVRKAYEIIEKVYRAAGVPNNCALASGNGKHRYYKKEAWEAFDRIVGCDKQQTNIAVHRH